VSLFAAKFQGSIWKLGFFFWMGTIAERSFAFFADGALPVTERVQLILVSLVCIAWISLKPKYLEAESLIIENIHTLKYYKLHSSTPQYESYRHKAEARMLQLEKYHLITQEYFLPIPYFCQIYHLLNLKHLESVHSFSLSSLKVIDVSQLEATTIGGIIKFQTVIDSSSNMLSILRQPTVEVELTLHTPYTIELNIPVYNGKKIVVIFNILPLGNDEHKLFIDIYSNLTFPRPILQVFLHFASGLTMLEDLPYLHKLARTNIYRSVKVGKSNHKTMQLFNRFVDLYGSSLQQPPLNGAVELRPISNPSS
jgi:hypothetical protein